MKSSLISNSLTDVNKSWSSFAWGSAFFLFLPIIAIFFVALSGYSDAFEHLYDTVLFAYIKNSLILLFGVCSMTLIWGVPSAWLVSYFDFPGRKLFRWALLLPMAMPAYLVAFVYTDFFDYAGPVQTVIRTVFGWQTVQDYWFFDMRTMGGAIFVLSLVFSPYVYWLLLLNFTDQSQSLQHAARVLGASERQIFWRITLPLARPAIAVACTLVGMETLADYGTVAYFSVWHITTAIYDTWLQHYDLPAAAKLSCLLLIFVLMLIIIERRGRKGIANQNNNSPILRRPLKGKKSALAIGWCTLVVSIGFAFPAGILLFRAIRYFFDTDWVAFAQMSQRTFFLALSVGGLAMFIGFLLQIYARIRPQVGNWLVRIASLGYATPGTVLAIGVLIITTQLDHGINWLTRAFGMGNVGLIVSGTMLAMAFAFLCRFAAVGIGTIDAGMSKIPRHLDDCAYIHGYYFGDVARTVWLPLLRNSLLTAFLLVFLESMKELSAAILLRPFNVQVLSTYIYEYMSAENFEVAALPSLVMVVIGLPPVLLLTYSMDRKK